jgi:hypothetical protein
MLRSACWNVARTCPASTRPNAVAHLEVARKAGYMSVGGLITEIVADADVSPVAPMFSDDLDNPRARCDDRRSVGRSVVDSLMEAAVVQDWMNAPAKAVAEAAAYDGFRSRNFVIDRPFPS